MFASGCGNALVGDQGILLGPNQRRTELSGMFLYLREHQMEGHPELLSDMYVGKAWRVGNDNISNKWPMRCITHDWERITRVVVFTMVTIEARRRAETVACLNARSPATHYDLFDALSPFCYLSTLQCIYTGHEARVFDHESHKFRRITSDSEELQVIFFNESLERGMRSNSNTMTVSILQYLSECNKRLDIASGADDLYNNVKSGWRCLTR